jgi:hypothetical protein
MTPILRIRADFLRFYPRKSDQSAESAFYFLVVEQLPSFCHLTLPEGPALSW